MQLQGDARGDRKLLVSRDRYYQALKHSQELSHHRRTNIYWGDRASVLVAGENLIICFQVNEIPEFDIIGPTSTLTLFGKRSDGKEQAYQQGSFFSIMKNRDRSMTRILAALFLLESSQDLNLTW